MFLFLMVFGLASLGVILAVFFRTDFFREVGSATSFSAAFLNVFFPFGGVFLSAERDLLETLFFILFRLEPTTFFRLRLCLCFVVMSQRYLVNKDVDGRDRPGHDGSLGINRAWPRQASRKR